MVVATGPTWTPPDVPGANPERVRLPTDLGTVLHPGAEGPVVLLGGGKPALTLAAALRTAGRPVTVVEPGGVFGAELGLPGRWRMVADAEASGVALVADATVTRITDTEVELTVAGAARRLPAPTVVTTTRVAGAPGLATALEARGIRVFVVGDAGRRGASRASPATPRTSPACPGDGGVRVPPARVTPFLHSRSRVEWTRGVALP